MNRTNLFLIVFLALLVGFALSGTGDPQAAQANDDSQRDSKLTPVETNIHEFMEYEFEPTYKRLKPLMASAQTASAGWRAIKSDSLILAEGANLLLIRQPPHASAKWAECSVAVRDAGAQLYRGARQRNFSASRTAYRQMITNCNSCHRQFAGGKHLLTP